jgi:hypothetical protein
VGLDRLVGTRGDYVADGDQLCQFIDGMALRVPLADSVYPDNSDLQCHGGSPCDVAARFQGGPTSVNATT